MKKIVIAIGFISLIIIVYFCLMPPDHKIKNAIPAGETIVCFGDSLTYGTGAERGMDYPSQLSGMIGMPVVNEGMPGDTTSDSLRRIDDVLKKNPRIVLITLGGNDLKNGVSKDIAFSNLEMIIEKIQEKGALVILGGIDVPFFGKGFGNAYSVLARKTGSILIPNIFKGILGHPDLMSDSIHPNSAGYTIMAKHFHKAVKPYLEVDS
jgi:lysophospholipase L1-like esterase